MELLIKAQWESVTGANGGVTMSLSTALKIRVIVCNM